MEEKKRGILQIQNSKVYVILISVIFAFLIFFSFTIPYFVSIATIINLIRQSTVLTILAIGMSFVILAGGIDLSIGSNIALTGVITALVLNATGGTTASSSLAGILCALLFGTMFGCLNGFLVGYLNITAFMATLATMSLGRGLTLYISNSTRIIVDNQFFNYLGSAGFHLLGVRIPSMIIVLIPVIIVSYFLLKFSVLGRCTYAVGGNPVASYASGINVKKQIVLVYSFMGLMCGIAAVITIGRSSSAQPLAAIGVEFDAITAVVLGGISLAGGLGTIAGTLLGSLLIGVLFLGINMINVPIYFVNIIKGLFILVAVIAANQFTVNYSTKVEKKIIKAKKNKSAHNKIIYDNKLVLCPEEINNSQVLTLKNISKYFPGVQALKNVTFEIKRGTVHALVGENGAGKSTLIKILSGVYQKDEGEILLGNRPITIKSPEDSLKFGISVIYQEFALVPELSIAQNIFLGKEILNKTKLLLAGEEMRKKAKKLISKFGLYIDADVKVKELSVAKQQMVEIVKAVSANAWIIVMDEPTSAISESEKVELFNTINDLKNQGAAILYITHRIQEIFEIADEATVLRDGQHIVTLPISKLSKEKLIYYMVDRELKDIFSRKRVPIGKEVLRVENLYRKGVFSSINFSVREGEVVGMAGLIGAGRTEIARCIYGMDRFDGGKIFLKGVEVRINSPKEALMRGICYVSEDRRREGIIPMMSVKENISLASINIINRLGWIISNSENQMSSDYIKKLNIKTSSDSQLISNLSGGNQQKCCLAKMLAYNPKLIILDEPTRGIDIGAKVEIHKLIEGLAASGMAVIIISSELPEIMGVSDKIIVLAEGKQKRTINNTKSITQQEIMTYATIFKSDKVS